MAAIAEPRGLREENRTLHRAFVQTLQELGVHREVHLIVSSGIRTGADVAKALALGADTVSIGIAALIALGDNAREYNAECRKLETKVMQHIFTSHEVLKWQLRERTPQEH